jgi:uncharacterized protein
MGNIMKDSEEKYGSSEKVIDIALRRSGELNIRDFVIASCSGKTIDIFLKNLNNFKKMTDNKDYSGNKSESLIHGLNIVCVTHQVGFESPNKDEMQKSARMKLTECGINILTATHLLGGVDRALRIQFKGVYPSEIVSSTLRMLGQGLKVCLEISVMAADAGLVHSGSNLIAIGGTGFGADTAAVISPSHSQNFFETRIKEIICKPFEF